MGDLPKVQDAIEALRDGLTAAGATWTPISLGEVEQTGFTVADLIQHLERLPQSWRVRVKTGDLGDGLETWGPVTGWEAGSGEVLLLSEDGEPGETE